MLMIMLFGWCCWHWLWWLCWCFYCSLCCWNATRIVKRLKFEKTRLTEWLSDWVCEKMTTIEAITSQKCYLSGLRKLKKSLPKLTQETKKLNAELAKESGISETIFGSSRPRLKRSESQWRDRDWKGLSLNDEIETETENVWVSMTR